MISVRPAVVIRCGLKVNKPQKDYSQWVELELELVMDLVLKVW